MKCRYFCRLPLDISPVYLTRGISKCIIKKGFFPESAKNINEKFCFVNLDMDLYNPTLMGLEWFGNRMIKGGCILVHDYFSETFMGVRQAVNEYLENHKNIYYLPIGDGISIALVGY